MSARSSAAESLASRHSLALVALLLAGCSVKGEQEQAASAEGSAAAAPETVSCALKGSDAFKERCTIERSASDGRNFIVLRHPDGGFRRLEELEAGKRYKSVDGADEVAVDANGADIELTVGEDHYLFPGQQTAPQSNAPHT